MNMYSMKPNDSLDELTLLEAFKMVAPLIHKLVQEDMSISIYDTEKLVAYHPAKTFNLGLTLGEKLVDGDILSTAIQKNKEMHAVVPKEIFGVPFASNVIPIHDSNGRVIGGVGLATSIERATKLHEVAINLSSIVEQTVLSLNEITTSVNNLANSVSNGSTHIKEVSTGANEIDTISKVVKGISDQSNLLGLNASIEAARAGEHGRGFSVVADEIRKLATNSKENVSQIDTITKTMQEAIHNLNDAFNGISKFTEQQVNAINEISQIIDEINKNAQQLSNMAGKIE